MPAVTGTLGNNDWYVSDVSVGWTVTDAESAISSQTGCSVATLTTDTSGTTYTCQATSAGGTSSNSVTVKRDATAPTDIAVSADRPADSGDWYNAPFTATWSGSDATSGIALCEQTTYSGPDDASGSISGTCTDQAGNEGAPVSFAFMYDATGPTVVGTPDRVANVNGWYNASVTVTWSAQGDQASDVTCDDPSTYAGPDDATVTLSGSCTDAAGNTGTGTFGLSYDATAPSASIDPDRAADSNGWYNHAFTATTTGTDDLSGIDSCTAPQTYTGPDTSTGSLAGACTDLAGNTSAPASLSFDYDATAPSASIDPDRAADSNGWYNHAFTATTTGTDNLSGIDSCSAPQEYSGPDVSNGSLSGSCTDEAGNASLEDTMMFNYDATDPDITLTSRTAANGNGWNNTNVQLEWACSDALSGTVSSSVSETVSTEGAGQTATGTCNDVAGNSASDTQTDINIDKSAPNPPVVDVTPAANGAGWNNSVPVTVSFSANGDNGPSGVASCSPDVDVLAETAGQLVTGTCEDLAGNTSPGASATVKVDLTDPNAPAVATDRAPDYVGASGSWFRDTVTITFTDQGDVGTVQSGVDPSTIPAPVTRTTSGEHTVSGSLEDVADNESAAASITVKVDATAPAVTATCPGSVLLGATASAQWSASDGQSGLATASTGSIPLNTSAVGSQTATVPAGSARDNVGYESGAATCSYTVVYGWNGFLQPVNDTAHQTGVAQSKFRLGQTIPLKFRLTNAAGASVTAASTPTFVRSANRGACDAATVAETVPDATATGGSTYRWDADGTQYIYNFSTKGLTSGEYRVWATNIGDGVNHYVDICLTK